MKRVHVYPDEQNNLWCPYCGEEIQEWWNYFNESEGNSTEDIECPHCKKYFSCEVDWTPLFTTYRYEDE